MENNVSRTPLSARTADLAPADMPSKAYVRIMKGASGQCKGLTFLSFHEASDKAATLGLTRETKLVDHAKTNFARKLADETKKILEGSDDLPAPTVRPPSF